MLSFSKRSLIALMLALAVLAALFCVSISAAEETTVAETTVGETTEKLGAFLRSVRSETKKKISWSSFKDTKKNTIVVLVVVAVIAVVIFILDSAFGYGIKYLRELVQGLVR